MRSLSILLVATSVAALAGCRADRDHAGAAAELNAGSSAARMALSAFAASRAEPAQAVRTVASTVTFTNRAGKLLYIYYGLGPAGGVIMCDNFTDGGSFAPGAQRIFTVPEGQVMWIRFQESTDGRGCPSNVNKFESWVTGTANGQQSVDVT